MKRINEETVAKAIRDIQDKAYERFGRSVEICIAPWVMKDSTISVEVSWASIGAQTPDNAVAFANKILEAVEMAKSFPYTGAVLRYEGDDVWYEMEDEEEDTEERREYKFGELEAFLNWEEDEYDVDGIMTEVTFVDPVTGDRYWDPEFVDDEEKLFEVCMRYHKDDDEDEDDDEDKKVLDEDFCAQFRENVISDEWSKNEAEQLFVRFPDKTIEGDVDFGIDDLVDGWGHEQVLEDILAEATEKDPSDWDAEFAFDKVLSMGVAYRRVTEGDPRRLDKHDMFRRWAAVLGSEITEEELTDKDPGGRGVLEYAAGYVRGIEVEATYRRYDK